jgi:hypothetical protein
MKISSLKEFEKKVFSQNGEDGIIEKLINSIYPNPKNKIYLEIGTESGIQCNTRYLREFYEWSGILIDSEHENASINLYKHYVNQENIIEILNSLSLPKKLEFLSIDIDSIDFYVLNEILKKYTFDILVCEYNVGFGPNDDKVVEYTPNLKWDGTNYYGASLKSFTLLCNKYGYSLIGTDSIGVNAFFISDKFIHDKIITMDQINDVTNLYSIGRFGPGPYGGQPSHRTEKKYTSAKIILNL